MCAKVPLEILIDKALAEEIIDNGLAEIVFRRADAKFKSMVKCQLPDNILGDKNLPNKILANAMAVNKRNNYNFDSVRKAVYSIDRTKGLLSETAKNIAAQVDNIYSLTGSLKDLAYLNTGLSLANIAVDIAGFVLVTEKLNLLNAEVQKAAKTIAMVANIQKNEIISECQKLIMRSNAIGSKLKASNRDTINELENLLIDLRAFISKIVRNLNDEALRENLVLQMVYTLLPTYTSLFSEFVKVFYFEKHYIPENYEMFLDLYNELGTESFMNRIEDFFFLEKDMHIAETVDTINAQILLSLNGKVQIEDQKALLETLKTEEQFLLMDSGIQKYTSNHIRELIPIIAERSGIDEDECLKLFNIKRQE